MKQNGVVCLPGPALLFFIFRFECLISGPKSYRDFRETGPRIQNCPGFPCMGRQDGLQKHGTTVAQSYLTFLQRFKV